MDDPHSIAVIGTGPAGLMAADRLRVAGYRVILFDQQKGSGRKLLIAGSSGLNISNGLPVPEFAQQYSGLPVGEAARMLKAFPPAAWLKFIETELGLPTFLGTSGRYFVREMKAAGLVKRWNDRLKSLGVEWRLGHTWMDFGAEGALQFRDDQGQEYTERFAAVVMALGGGSYLPSGERTHWSEIFVRRGIPCEPFRASNVGYQVAWHPKFLAEAVRQPLKNVILRTARGERRGEVLITEYGVEGTPVYTVGQSGAATLDLKPDLTLAQVEARLREVKENLAPLRRVEKKLGLDPAAQALLFHHGPAVIRQDIAALAQAVKAFPLALGNPQPLAEAISSAGGVKFAALNAHGALRDYPWVFPVGEMLDWDAPTGGFLIQGCVAQGAQVAERIRFFLLPPVTTVS